MVELGAKQEELNRAFGRQAAAVCDYAVLVGERQAVPIKAGLLDEGYPENRIFVEHDLTAALKTVENIRAGDQQKVVLLENDLRIIIDPCIAETSGLGMYSIFEVRATSKASLSEGAC